MAWTRAVGGAVLAVVRDSGGRRSSPSCGGSDFFCQPMRERRVESETNVDPLLVAL